MRLKAILFDFGGTLDGPGRHWIDRFASLYEEVGLDVSFGRLSDAFGHATGLAYADPAMRNRRLRETVAFHVEHQMAYMSLAEPALQARVIDRFVSDAEAALAESKDVLTRLSRRLPIGVISNFYGNVELLLIDAGIQPLLDVVVDSTNVGVSKPNPEIFQLALQALGCAPADVMYVGDSFEKDVVAACEAGLRTGWLIGDREQACPDPAMVDATLRRLADVEALLA